MALCLSVSVSVSESGSVYLSGTRSADKDVANVNMMASICKKYLIYLPRKKNRKQGPNANNNSNNKSNKSNNNEIKCPSPAALMASG